MPLTELGDLLASFGLSESLQRRLLAVSQIDENVHRQRIRMTNEMITEIPIELRAKLYEYLQEDDENIAQANAFRFCGGSVDEWLGGVDLRPELCNRIESMVFQSGSHLVFADLRLILPELGNEKETSVLLKALSRDSTLVMSLHFDEQSDVDQLVRYWGRNGRAKDVRPILESLALQPGGGSIDVSHLLPAIPRRLLYTYPNLTTDAVVGGRDCHWTAHNFCNIAPDDRLVTEPEEELPRLLSQEFYEVFGEFRFGDVVTYMDKNNKVFHSAVYIADDVVFTKNGLSSLRPWHFRRLPEMNDYYSRREAVHLAYFRRKTS